MNAVADLHRQAKQYYYSLSPSEQAQMTKLFHRLDEDGSRKIWRRELALAVCEEDRQKIMSHFDILDADCDGALDFDECITLFYVLKFPEKMCTTCNRVLTEPNASGTRPTLRIADFKGRSKVSSVF